MKRKLKSGNVATLLFGKAKSKAVAISFKNEPSEADTIEAEALATKQNAK